MTQASAGAAKIMWGKLRQAELPCVLLDNVPDHLLRDVFSLDHTFPRDSAKHFALEYASGRQPIINLLLDPTGNRNGSNMPTFANEIHYRPMLFATLEMIEREFDQFSSSQSVAQQHGQHGSVPLPLQCLFIGQLPEHPSFIHG